MTPTITRRRLLAAGGVGLTGVGSGYVLLERASGPSTPTCDSSPPAKLDSPALGSSNAAVTVAEYVDYSCPHCRDYALNVFPKIRSKFVASGAVHYVHHDFPIPVDDWSRPAANAAREVQRLGGDQAMFAYTMALFRRQDDFSYGLFKNFADRLNANIDGEKVRQAAKSGAYCKLLNTESKQASNRGVSATPTVYVNEKKLEAPSANSLISAIEKSQQ
ncbi:thioredoxin domain-containing protein [Halococcus thailandensis]|uniref:thioredoxin domain-containing protein n=1 Tax=Halococcus thailandensis TaxID=335952 RepID=UPI0009B5C33B|nr:thioredoxin domain-containing protein [Halococcus thailandensis]